MSATIPWGIVTLVYKPDPALATSRIFVTPTYPTTAISAATAMKALTSFAPNDIFFQLISSPSL